MMQLQSPTQNPFLKENQQELAELMTFVDFAEGLTIGFIEINNPYDANVLIHLLESHFSEEILRFEVIDFSLDQNLRFLKDDLVEALGKIILKPKQKLVLIIRGLEKAIGTDVLDEYPPILQDLNFVRDSYREKVPHPLLFILPDYAISRVAEYAPDFWAWQSGIFRFKTSSSDQLSQPKNLATNSDSGNQYEQITQNQELFAEMKDQDSSKHLGLEPKILDSMHLGVMVVSSQLELLYCNLKAKDICQNYWPTFKTLPAKLLDACKRFMTEADASQSEPLVLECYPVPGRKLLIQISWMQESLTQSLSSQPCMLVFIKDCYEAIIAKMKRDQKRYGFTDREAQIWMMLDLTFSYQEVADQLGMSLNTVKTHVKNINLKRRGHPQDSRLWFAVEPDWLDNTEI